MGEMRKWREVGKGKKEECKGRGEIGGEKLEGAGKGEKGSQWRYVGKGRKGDCGERGKWKKRRMREIGKWREVGCGKL